MFSNLPVELHKHIAGFLSQPDIYSLMLCSRKICRSTLPSLYQNIDLTSALKRNDHSTNDYRLSERLEKLVAELHNHPERCQWVLTAKLIWSFKFHIAQSIRPKLLEALKLLPLLRSLDIRQSDGVGHSGCNSFPPPSTSYGRDSTSPFCLSHAISCLSATSSLQDLVFEDVVTTWTDMDLFFRISTLRKLTIINFHHLAASSPNSQLDLSRLPARNIQDITFIETRPSNGVQDHVGLFAALGKVSTLRWQIFPSWNPTNRFEINAALYCLKDTLTELHLTRYWAAPTFNFHGIPNPNHTFSFADFSSLKILDIPSLLLFPSQPPVYIAASSTGPARIEDPRSLHARDLKLSDRLPMSLEFLEVSQRLYIRKAMLLIPLKIWFEHKQRAFCPSERKWHQNLLSSHDDVDWLISLAIQSSAKSAKLSIVKLVELDRDRDDIRVPIRKELSPRDKHHHHKLASALEETGLTVELFLGSDQALNWDRAHVLSTTFANRVILKEGEPNPFHEMRDEDRF